MKYILMLLLSTSSFAASTGSIVLSGTIPKIVSITVTPTTGYNNLDLSTTATNKVVATVTEISNTATGYKVTISSLNSGQLKNGSNNFAYTAKYNGTNFTLSSTAVTITNTSSSGIVNVQKDLSIGYTGVVASSLLEGTYSDSLTFTITAN